ncbi:MAG: hypothetical protein ACEY3A_03550 [Wolbachia sp.]
MTNGLNSMIQEIKNDKKIDQGTFALVLKQPQTMKETKIHEFCFILCKILINNH